MAADELTPPRCEAVEEHVQIGNQVEQTARCRYLAGHLGAHRAVILDSDDNPIFYTFIAVAR